MNLISKVRDLIAAVRASDWATAIRLTLEIITLITQSPQPMFATGAAAPPKMKAAFAAASNKTADELADDLEACCNQHAPPAGATTAAPTGPFISLLLPLLMSLMQRLLGF